MAAEHQQPAGVVGQHVAERVDGLRPQRGREGRRVRIPAARAGIDDQPLARLPPPSTGSPSLSGRPCGLSSS